VCPERSASRTVPPRGRPSCVARRSCKAGDGDFRCRHPSCRSDRYAVRRGASASSSSTSTSLAHRYSAGTAPRLELVRTVASATSRPHREACSSPRPSPDDDAPDASVVEPRNSTLRPTSASPRDHGRRRPRLRSRAEPWRVRSHAGGRGAGRDRQPPLARRHGLRDTRLRASASGAGHEQFHAILRAELRIHRRWVLGGPLRRCGRLRRLLSTSAGNGIPR